MMADADTSEMEDIFEDIENEYDENDDEFFDDSLDLDSLDSSSDLSNDSGLPDTSTNKSVLSKSGQEDMDEYLERAWKQMEMDVEAELSRKKEISGENITEAVSENKKPENLEITQSLVQTDVIKEDLPLNETPRPEEEVMSDAGSGSPTLSDKENDETTTSENLENAEKADNHLGIWVPDAMLPPDSGFMIKKCASKNAKTYFKTPDGQVFDSRRKVLQEMLINGIYPQLYGYMYQGLLQDGWTINQSLPEGWLYKYNKMGSDSFLDHSFNLYATRRKAREKIEEIHGNFSAALKRFDEQTFKREKAADSSPREMQHNNEAESLPKGFRLDPKTQIIICPSGNHYNSRVEAFQQMCSQQQPEELRTEMFDKLIFEGFQAHELLAPGWIYKQDNYQLSFLDYNGIYLHSLSEAQHYFKEIFSLEEYNNFEKFLSVIFGEVKTEEDPANTVPEGWSVTEEGVTGPGGQQFRSRLEALITLLETGEREQEAEIMRQCLYYEGWCDDQYLPYMWKYKLDPETGAMMFLTREGGVLSSPGEAVTFIRAHSPPFTPEDVQRIDYVSSQHHLPGQEIEHGAAEALEERENASQPQRPDYSEDKSLPRGWKIKLEWTGKGQCILSPSGTVFKSRRSAYETMVAEKCPNEDIEAMRNVLKYEGWLDNPELPEGWKIKPTKTNTLYIDRGGQMFKSAKQAAKFVRDYSQFFSQADIEKINKIANINQPPKEKKEPEWNANDPLIPPGWMSRMCKKRRMVKKPDGIVFKSLRMALEHLMKYKKVSEAAMIRECLLHEGWARLEAPHNWLYKPDAGRNYTIIFLSEQGTKFESKVKAINHLREINQFNEELRPIFDNAGKENKKRPNKQPDRTPSSSWALDKSLPENWKSKQSKENQQIKMVMSPKGQVFESVVKAYKYLCEQTDNEDMKQDRISMKNSLLNDHGYQESKSLPSGWIFKEDSTNQINFITVDGLRFSSVESARSHLHRSKQDVESVRIFEEFVSEFFKNRSSKMTEMQKLLKNQWVNNDETVPKGWSTKQKKDTTMIKLPDGNEFSSRTSALQHLIGIKADEDCIQELRGCLKHEGWLIHSKLPRNWFYKDFFLGHKQSILFLTRNGELIRSLDDAVQHIRKDSDSTDQAIENIGTFMSSLKSDTNEQVVNRKPIDLESVHKNDRMKLEVIQGLLNSEDEVKIEKARSHLKGRGWEENIYLPVSWMTRIPKQTSLINVMSPSGQLFNSYKALIGFLKDNPDYQEDDVRRLVSFPDGKRHKKVDALINSVLTSCTVVAEKTSSGGRTLKQYITALRSKCDPLEILKIKKCLLESGWKEDESVIPRNWLLRQRPGLTTITFVTDTGELLGNVKEANKCLKERGNGHTFYIDGEKCKSLFVDNYELELKRIEKFTKSKGDVPASKVQGTRKENQENQTKNYVSEKFSLDVLDMDRNKSISGFKNMFQQLEKFKKSVLSSPSTNSSFDFDLL